MLNAIEQISRSWMPATRPFGRVRGPCAGGRILQSASEQVDALNLLAVISHQTGRGADGMPDPAYRQKPAQAGAGAGDLARLHHICSYLFAAAPDGSIAAGFKRACRNGKTSSHAFRTVDRSLLMEQHKNADKRCVVACTAFGPCQTGKEGVS